MNIVVISASHGMENSQTSLILSPLLKGMESEGAQAETIYLKRLNLKPCKADVLCWFKHPGKCIIADSWPVLGEKLANKDLIIFAVPVFSGGANALFQIFCERSKPYINPDFVFHKKHFGHKWHDSSFPKEMILVSSCAIYELDNFYPIIAQAKSLAHGASLDYKGAVLRPHINSLFFNQDMANERKTIEDACFEAGRIYMTTQKLDKDLLNIIKSPLMKKKEYMRLSNAHFNNLYTFNQT